MNFLNDVEVRVLGALVEKDITTPDYYPLSLNALVNACNQKNNRDPVMMLDEDVVRDAVDSLQGQRLAGPANGADSRVTKYEHTAAFSRHTMPEVFKIIGPQIKRAQGRPGARCTRGLVCNVHHKKCAHEHTGSAETLRPSLRNGFTTYIVLSLVNRSLLPPSPPRGVSLSRT